MLAREYSSWRAFLLVLGPVVALINQGSIYIVNMWACGHHSRGSMHFVPFLCLLVAASGTLVSLRNWRRSGIGVGENESEESSTALITLAAFAIGAFSTAVIVAQWAAIVVFDPCMQS
jgi:hypothetical protein